MLEYISLFILLFTSLVGILEISRILTQSLFCKKTSENGYYVIPLYGETEKLEYDLRCATIENEKTIILLDCGITEQQLSEAKKISSAFAQAKLLKESEFADFLRAQKA